MGQEKSEQNLEKIKELLNLSKPSASNSAPVIEKFSIEIQELDKETQRAEILYYEHYRLGKIVKNQNRWECWIQIKKLFSPFQEFGNNSLIAVTETFEEMPEKMAECLEEIRSVIQNMDSRKNLARQYWETLDCEDQAGAMENTIAKREYQNAILGSWLDSRIEYLDSEEK